jgi:creatinine amidohydrolase
MKTVLLEQMTSPQIVDAIEAGYHTAIVAAGSIEQHGRHIPTGMDTMLGYHLAVDIAKGLGDALVAPVIRPGCSDHHMSFAGTISIPAKLLQEICRAYCRALCQHGFRRIALIPTHGGNFGVMEEVASSIDAELPCKVAYVNVLQDPKGFAAREQALAEWGTTMEEGGLHAGFFETSLLLASDDRQWADMEVAERGFVGDALARVEELQADGSWDIGDLSPIGVLGDPTRASIEAGRALLEVQIPIFVEAVRKALDYE